MQADPIDRTMVEAAIRAFDEHGIDFRAPWECDLDDEELGRFEALCAAITAQRAALKTAGFTIVLDEAQLLEKGEKLFKPVRSA